MFLVARGDLANSVSQCKRIFIRGGGNMKQRSILNFVFCWKPELLGLTKIMGIFRDTFLKYNGKTRIILMQNHWSHTNCSNLQRVFGKTCVASLSSHLTRTHFHFFSYIKKFYNTSKLKITLI